MEDSVLSSGYDDTADVDSSDPERRVCETCCAIYRTAFQRCPLDGGALVVRPDDPLIGSTIGGRYVVHECVGEGAMGRVYRAQHNRMSRQFALKVLFGDLAADERMRSRFAREAEAASRLSHPNVVSVVDFGETDAGLLYLAMDFVEGPTFGYVIAELGRLPEADVWDIAIDIAHGLSHAHLQGLIHRDLKPENIILSRQGSKNVPKIVDFGVAFLAETEGVKDGRLTQAGCIVGTPSFMAPEQALGDTVGPAADLFSFGVCLYTALAGVPPFQGDAITVLQQLMCDPIPSIRERFPDVEITPGFQKILDRLLEREVANRYQSAEAVLRDLTAAKKGAAPEMSSGVEVPESVTSMVKTSRGPRWPVLLGVVSAALVGAAIIFSTKTTAPAADTAGVAHVAAEPVTDPPPVVEPVEVLPEPPEKPAPAEVVDVAPAPVVTKKPVRRRRPPEPEPQKTPKVEPKPMVEPKPKVEPKPNVVPPAELRKRYLRVGNQLEAFAKARGEDAAKDLRARYFKIPFADALRIPTVRKDVVAALTAIERDITRARGQ